MDGFLLIHHNYSRLVQCPERMQHYTIYPIGHYVLPHMRYSRLDSSDSLKEVLFSPETF